MKKFFRSICRAFESSSSLRFARRSLVEAVFVVVWGVGCGVAVGGFGALPALAQREAQFTEEAQVTAIDLAISVSNALGAAPQRLVMDDLAVSEGGAAAPVVGLARLGSGEGAEPWRVVVYADLALASKPVFQSVVLNLAERAAKLAELGTVEIFVADPTPRPFLTATREVDRIETALSRLLIDHEGADELGGVRRAASEGLRALASGALRGKPGGDADPREVAAGALAEELGLVHRSQDVLLTWAARDRGAGPKALLWIGAGYDLDPGLFYRRLPGAASVGSQPRELSEATDALARSLAAYGWMTFPLSLADLGKGPSQSSRQFDEYRRRALDGPKGEESAAGTFTVQVGGGKKEAEAAEKAEEIALLDGRAPLASWAAETGGQVVSGGDQIDALLARLASSYRVTFQVTRQLDGRVRPVQVRATRGGLEVYAPRWVRSSTPEAVAEARVRRIVAGEYEVGELALSAQWRREATTAPSTDGLSNGTLAVKVDLADRAAGDPDAKRTTVRLTVAHGREGAAASYQHLVLTGQDFSGTVWTHELPLSLPADTEWLVAVVEDLASGSWGARDLEP